MSALGKLFSYFGTSADEVCHRAGVIYELTPHHGIVGFTDGDQLTFLPETVEKSLFADLTERTKVEVSFYPNTKQVVRVRVIQPGEEVADGRNMGQQPADSDDEKENQEPKQAGADPDFSFDLLEAAVPTLVLDGPLVNETLTGTVKKVFADNVDVDLDGGGVIRFNCQLATGPFTPKDGN